MICRYYEFYGGEKNDHVYGGVGVIRALYCQKESVKKKGVCGWECVSIGVGTKHFVRCGIVMSLCM